MNSLEKDFIPYELALDMKQIGYDGYSWFGSECSLYKPNGEHTFYMNGIGDGYISAPTFSQCFRWFRDKYRLYFSSHYSNLNHVGKWQWLINYEDHAKSSGFTNTYEEAELECLKQLIKIIKE